MFNFDTNSMFNGMFGKIQNGMRRLGMNGGIAVKCSNGYKTYNVKMFGGNSNAFGGNSSNNNNGGGNNFIQLMIL